MGDSVEEGVFASAVDPITGFSAYMDDDGRVAYAYLRDPSETIIGDVWLYNRGHPTPLPEWTLPNKDDLMPFKNPQGLVKDIVFDPISDSSEVDLRFVRDEFGAFDHLAIVLRGRLHGLIHPGDMPGRSLLALKDGPCARVLEAKSDDAENSK